MPEKHIEAAKQRLVDLASIAVETEATERRILAVARERLEAVRADLETLRPRALLDRDAGERYQALTLEAGQLELVIARAQQALGEG